MPCRVGSLARLNAALLLSAAALMVLPPSSAMAQAAPTDEAEQKEAEAEADVSGAASGATVLQRITVGGQSAKDKAYKTPAAVTSLDAVDVERFGQNSVGDLLRTVPGVFTESNTRSPALSVNIRGMQDFGRNAVTIDGARQNLQVSGHGSNGWVFVDPNLLVGIDVQRGIVSSAQGSGVIGGAVDFRTIGVDDVVQPGRQWGAMTKTTWGDNGFGRSGMAAAGVRVNEDFGFAGAISGRKSSDYTDAWGFPVVGTGQELSSGLLKLNANPGEDQKLDLGAVLYRNDWTVGATDMEADVNTFTAAYSYTPAGNDLIDLRINAYHNDARFEQLFGPSHISRNTLVEYKDRGTGGSIANTSRFDLGQAQLAVEYGGEYYFDAVRTTASSTVGGTPDGAYGGLTPAGDRGVGGVFSKSTLSLGRFDLIGALRYDAYTLTGSGYNTFPGGLIPVGPFSVDNSEGKLTGKGTLAFTPLEGIQIYGSWGTGFRPPAITETLMAGIHPGNMSFLRFRPNPFLKPEVSTGWEVGANLSFDGLLFADDRLRVKASYFDNEVEDYITSVWSIAGGINFTYMNTADPARLKGFELEANYDLGYVFAGLAYTNTDIRLAPPAPTFGLTLTPPKEVWTATAGLRLFDERLTLGGRVRFVSESEVFNVLGTITPNPEYRLYDAFLNLQVSENVSAFLTAENITNEGYLVAKDNSFQYGSGRTIMGGFTTKF